MIKLAQRLGASRFEADELYSQALAAFQREDYEEALALIDGAIQRHPSYAEYHATLGWFHYACGATLHARSAFDHALTINPYEMLANYGLGMLAYKDKDWEAAASYFLNAIAAQPNRPETLYYLSLVQHRLEDNKRAIQWMKSAREAFSSAGDNRERQCLSWIRQYEKLTKEDMARA